jgi:hypothetical protein
MLVVLDSVGVTSDSPWTFDITVAFPVSGLCRPPKKYVFGAGYPLGDTARLYLCGHRVKLGRLRAVGYPAPRISRGQGVWLGLTLCDSFFAPFLRITPTHPDTLY